MVSRDEDSRALRKSVGSTDALPPHTVWCSHCLLCVRLSGSIKNEQRFRSRVGRSKLPPVALLHRLSGYACLSRQCTVCITSVNNMTRFDLFFTQCSLTAKDSRLQTRHQRQHNEARTLLALTARTSGAACGRYPGESTNAIADSSEHEHSQTRCQQAHNRASRPRAIKICGVASPLSPGCGSCAALRAPLPRS
jgi:hypothetical protein